MLQEVAGQVTARTILARLQGRLVRHQFRLSRQPGRSTVSLGQHEKIVDTIAAGKPAEAAMRDHLRDVISQISQSRTPRTVPATS
ncbi:hypothetical protein CA984_13965 [Streptosporangium minutum]|uniref:GntR C-terminal domain-containing protein n=1 Tax=Streptosporangium minutum TaxID=569862 RepID=A0A243RQY3_9ACTN|nr:hypothetical protein CA984_13965 [Streptosporangium minutum]